MNTAMRWAEALMLFLVGAFMAALACSSMYWRFMNPKYSWLTLCAGATVAVLGLGSVLNSTRRTKPSELAALAAIILAGALAVSLPDPFFEGSQPGAFTPVREEAPASRMVVDGREYVRLNVAELAMLEARDQVRPGQAFAIQGLVVRTPELDRAGLIAVARLFIVCCFADAAGVSCLVEVDDPEDFTKDQWVQAAGRIRPNDLTGKKLTVPVAGALSAITSWRFILAADDIGETEMNGLPFLFEARKSEPFAY